MHAEAASLFIATPVAGALDAAGVTARLWLGPGAIRVPDRAARVWLRLAGGRLVALRLPESLWGHDEALCTLVEALREDERGERCCIELAPGARADVLYAAPIDPGLFVQRGRMRHALAHVFSAWRSGLDPAVTASLERLTERTGGTAFFASVRNYNRLLAGAAIVRRNRLQAIARFPALVVPVLLTRHRRYELVEARRFAERQPSRVIESAIADGSTLVDALARGWGISRSLVRSPLCARLWAWEPAGQLRALLGLVDALPAEKRPTRAAVLLAHEAALRAYLDVADPTDRPQPKDRVAQAHRRSFADGLEKTLERLATRHANLSHAIFDTRDFLAALADELADEPGDVPATPPLHCDTSAIALGTAWLALHGLANLLATSARWHDAQQTLARVSLPPGLVLPMLFGSLEAGGARAEELLSPEALAHEGARMQHCVASYWDRVLEGDRIVHLSLPEGEAATAQYRLVAAGDGEALLYELAQLRGPQNVATSAAMRHWAQAVCTLLNAPERAEAREAAFRVRIHRIRERERRTASIRPPLDRATRRAFDRLRAWLAAEPPRPWIALCAFVAGFGYHAGRPWLEQLRAGDPLDLVAEPDNAHDPLALALFWRGHKLGYVPRTDNAALHALARRGIQFEAEIDAVDPRAFDWECVRFAVRAVPCPTQDDASASQRVIASRISSSSSAARRASAAARGGSVR